MTIGEEFKAIRNKMNISQAEFAQLCNIHPVSFRKYETNKMKPQFWQMVRIAKALNISPCEFCKYYTEKEE